LSVLIGHFFTLNAPIGCANQMAQRPEPRRIGFSPCEAPTTCLLTQGGVTAHRVRVARASISDMRVVANFSIRNTAGSNHDETNRPDIVVSVTANSDVYRVEHHETGYDGRQTMYLPRACEVKWARQKD